MLQNYSDIRGVVIDDNESEKITLNEDIFTKLIFAYTQWLSDNNKNINKIAVGRDSRLKGLEFKNIAINTIIDLGHNAVDCDLTTSPALFHAIEYLTCDGGIMITASHLPFNRNGIKFFTINGGINFNDLNEIIEIASNSIYNKMHKKGNFETFDINSIYCERIKKFIKEKINCKNNYDKPLQNLKIVVDAGNGSGGFITEKILIPLGSDTKSSINLEPDGNFPNHEPNTESLSAIKDLQKQVIEMDADLGVLLDSDADRCAFVNNQGKAVMHDNLVALLASIIIEEDNNKITIATDSITSDDLTNFIQKKLGNHHHRFKRGYRKVINEAIRLNKEGINCPLAIETSGHAAFKENGFIDDGVFLAAKVIIKLAQLKQEGITTVSEFFEQYYTLKELKQFRLKILSPNVEIESNRIIQTFKQYSDTVPGWRVIMNNFDGVRITADKYFGDGWLLLRLSLHEPVMVLNLESGSKKGIQMLLTRVIKLLSRVNSVDLSPINKYLEKKQ